MSQQPQQLPANAGRRYYALHALFGGAWGLVALIGPNRLGFAAGGVALIAFGVLFFARRHETFEYVRATRRLWYTPSETMDRFNIFAFGVLTLVMGALLVGSAVAR